MENNKEFLEIVKVILENEEFQKRSMYLHHGKTSVYDHSLKVSYLSYNLAKKINLD